MKYCVNETADEPIMLINTHIGIDYDDNTIGIDGAEFQRELLYLDGLGKKSIKIWINSVGGNVMEGLNITSSILDSKTPVDTYNYGIAASIAGVIFMCGRNRLMLESASLMMHPVSGGDDKVMLKAMQDGLATILAAKSNITPEAVNDLMDKTTWINAIDCKDSGFATEIKNISDKNKKRAVSATNYMEVYASANKMINSILQPINRNSMNKVTNRLGLSDDASEGSILDAITAIENKSKEEIAALKKQIAESEDALNATKDKCNALEIEVETEKDSKKEIEAKNMVDGFAKLGRIKNDEPTIAKWVALAKNDLDGTKNLLTDLPINQVANQIAINGDADQTKRTPESFMNEAMKEITNRTKNK